MVVAERRMLLATSAALAPVWPTRGRGTLPVTAAALPPDPSALTGAGQAWFGAMTVHLLPAAEQTFLAGVRDAGGDLELLRVTQMKDEYLAALPNQLVGVPDSA